MRLRFSKMEGAGNDFMVVDATAMPFDLKPEEIRALADRHFGVGFDQLLVIEPPRSPDTDFYYRIFNRDGSEVEQCGNGARCFVRYVHDRGLTTKRNIRVQTVSGVIEPRLEPDGRVTVDMGVPRFQPSQIPFLAPARALTYALDIGGRIIEISAVSMGNPHAVQVVADVETAPVELTGPLIEHHSRFPKRVNAGFMQVVSRSRIRLRVWERGAGETLACGTGACADCVASMVCGHTERQVKVSMPGGLLEVLWREDGEVLLTGDAEVVYRGEWLKDVR